MPPPVQVHPFPGIEKSVNPEGTSSVPHSKPHVGIVPALGIVTVYVAFVLPWVKLQVCARVTLIVGPIGLPEKLAAWLEPKFPNVRLCGVNVYQASEGAIV